MGNMMTVDAPTGGGFKLNTPGDYIVIAERADRKTGPKADYFAVCFRVVGRVNVPGETGIDSSCAGAYFYDNLSLAPKAQWKIARMAYFVGHDAGAVVDLDDQGAVEDFLLDREAVLTVSVDDDGRGYGPRSRWTGDGRRTGDDDKALWKPIYDDRGEPYNEAWYSGSRNGNGPQETAGAPF